MSVFEEDGCNYVTIEEQALKLFPDFSVLKRAALDADLRLYLKVRELSNDETSSRFIVENKKGQMNNIGSHFDSLNLLTANMSKWNTGNDKGQWYNSRTLKARRQALGFTNQSFAEFSNLSVNTIMAWDQGRNSPLPVYVRILDWLEDGVLDNPNR